MTAGGDLNSSVISGALRALHPQHEWFLTLVSPKWSLFCEESCPPTKLSGAY